MNEPPAYRGIFEKLFSRPVLTSLAAGGVAGAVAKTLIAPFDRTKIHFQVSPARFSYSAVFKFLVASYREHGFLSLWRGNSATMVRIVPYAACQFGAFEFWKQVLLTYLYNSPQATGAPGRPTIGVRPPSGPTPLTPPPLVARSQSSADDSGRSALNRPAVQPLGPLGRFMSGALAGMTATSLTYPLDFVRCRMAVTHQAKYKTIWTTIRLVWREEGASALFRGYVPTVLGQVPYAGVAFFTYESLKKFYAGELAKWVAGNEQRTVSSEQCTANSVQQAAGGLCSDDAIVDNDWPVSAVHRLCFGGLAGLAGQTSSYPLDMVRRRMQTARLLAPELDHSGVYGSIRASLRYILRQEGIRGLYKGLSMNFFKGPLANSVAFTIHDLLKDVLDSLFA